MVHENRTLPTLDQLKAQAKSLRKALMEKGTNVTHSQALEMMAKQLGFRDWNTASARLSNRPGPPVAVGQRVSGQYLKQEFTGTVVGIRQFGGPDNWRVSVHFDEPVDVVTFDSFSSYRQRVSCTVDQNGKAISRTSDGQPHLVLRN